MKALKFTAVWCPSCLIMHSRYQKIEEEYGFDVYEYDYDFDSEKIEEYNIGDTLPVYILLDENDNELVRIIGEKKEEELRKIISSIER